MNIKDLFERKNKSKTENKSKKSTEKMNPLEDVPVISTEILNDFRKNVGRFRAETGGMIGCRSDRNHVDLWVFDHTSRNTSSSFAYNEIEMTKYYKRWKEVGATVGGFVHSHPMGFRQPSTADIKMSVVLMDFFKTDFFYMPIIQSDKKGNYELLFYIVRKATKQTLTLELSYTIKATDTCYEYYKHDNEITVLPLDKYRSTPKKTNFKIYDNNIQKGHEAPDDEFFARLRNFYPEKVLQKVLIYVGCGGVRSEIINMARNGFKNFILIDGDTISPTNIATQGVYRKEVGRYKVDAIADELREINPNVNVVCVPKMLDDNMSDKEFKSYLSMFPNNTPTDYLLLGMTDNHHAQTRVAKLALNLGTAYIGAAMYQYGLGADLIFTYPGVTSSCPRCMLRSRYEAYENGFVNNVTSESCPTFATERLNTTIGFVSLMLLMYKSAPGNPYNDMLDSVADRNFIQIRMSPFLEDMLNISTFNMAFKDKDSGFTYFDETIWLPQHPDHPKYGEATCKLCEGKGDLRTLKNKWKDTRVA